MARPGGEGQRQRVPGAEQFHASKTPLKEGIRRVATRVVNRVGYEILTHTIFSASEPAKGKSRQKVFNLNDSPEVILEKVRKALKAGRPSLPNEEYGKSAQALSVGGIDLIRSAHIAYEAGDDRAGF